MIVDILVTLAVLCANSGRTVGTNTIQKQTCSDDNQINHNDMLLESHNLMQSLNSSLFIAYLNEENDISKTRDYILSYYIDTFNLYYSMYSNVREEYWWNCSCKLRWPVAWYLGHTASFYINKLKMANASIIDRTGTENEELFTEFDHIFGQGVDESSWNDFVPQHPCSYWPNVNSLKAYCENTKEIVIQTILNSELTIPINKSQPIWWSILMGIEHERIHLETSGMLLRQLPLNKCKSIHQISGVWKHEYPLIARENISSNPLVQVPGKEITMGRNGDLLADSDHEMDFFGWDTEYGRENVSPFNASSYLVSNYEYYLFYKDNGYRTPEYWSSDAWKWLLETDTSYPKFWIYNSETEQFRLRNLFTQIDMKYAWNRPVITNHYEADAFIAWKSKQLQKNLRLISEAEWYVLRTLSGELNVSIREWAANTNTSTSFGKFSANTNFYYFASESPIDLFAFGDTGLFDIVGNVHHHTSTINHPMNGYEVDPFYVDFTTPFFNDSYYLMKGGSWMSSGNMAMIYNRCQWFRAHYFQTAGIRYIESSAIDETLPVNPKQNTAQFFKNTDESDSLLNENINLEYANTDYRQTMANAVIANAQKGGIANALHIGCGVGGVSYALGMHIGNVIGIDDRARFVGTANQMKQNRKLSFFMKNAFGKNDYKSVSLDSIGGGVGGSGDNVQFIHARSLEDLCDISALGNTYYDLIIGHLMFSRYSIGNGRRLWDMMSDNATLILFEDYSWNFNSQTDMDGMAVITDVLSESFDLLKQFDVEIAIEKFESARIRQLHDMHCTVWSKRKL